MKNQRELELKIKILEANEDIAIKAIFRSIDAIRKEQKNEKQPTR